MKMKKSKPGAAGFPRPEHNHESCQAAVLERAHRQFEKKGIRLTELRRSVLNEIAGSHEALGAYEVLERLARKGTRLAPISLYRAIDALLAAGAVHRLESRNAFFACHAQHASSNEDHKLFLVCESCGRVAEVGSHRLFGEISTAAEEVSFLPKHTVAEVSGLCTDCRRA
jgi:Fur family transcriptional regulator, zinc uptake regulator